MTHRNKTRFLSRLITQVLTCTAMVLVYLAHAYESLGIGINPFIALPIATLLLVEPYVRDQYLNIR